MSLGLTNAENSIMNYESQPVFTINKEKGIPGKEQIRTVSQKRLMQSLMQKPQHKQGTTKFNNEMDERTIAPLTSEDLT